MEIRIKNMRDQTEMKSLVNIKTQLTIIFLQHLKKEFRYADEEIIQ